MALATPPLLQQRIFAIASRKRFSKIQSFIGDAALHVKFNPDNSEGLVGGVAAEVATVEVDATDIILRVDGTIDRSVTFSGKTVQQLVDEINATEPDDTNRWRAGVGDVLPGVSAALATLGEENAMLGYLRSVGLPAAVNILHLAVGTDRSNRGQGYFLPDGFNTNYNYPLQKQTGGIADPLPSQVGRAGGIDASQGEDVLPQRRSAFRNSPSALAQERYPSASRFVTVVDAITNNGLETTGTSLFYAIFEDDGAAGNKLWETIQAEAVTEIAVPNVTCRGPAFLSVVGDTAANFTAGSVAMYGDMRVA